MAGTDKEPLSAAELQADAQGAGPPEFTSDDEPGRDPPSGETPPHDTGERGPNPIAGTMLPPD
jgi:hypothetical protein